MYLYSFIRADMYIQVILQMNFLDSDVYFEFFVYL